MVVLDGRAQRDLVFLPEESVTGKRRGEGEGWVEERWKGLSLGGAAGVRRWAPGSREGGDGKVSERGQQAGFARQRLYELSCGGGRAAGRGSRGEIRPRRGGGRGGSGGD